MRLFIVLFSLALTLSPDLTMAETINITVVAPKPIKNLVLKPNATEGYAQTMQEPRAPNAPQQALKQVSPPTPIFRGMGKVSATPSEAFSEKP